MKVLFLTIGQMGSINDFDIYPDLLRCIKRHGHDVYTVSPYEKRTGLSTKLIEEDGVKMLHVRIGNITKCGIIEKGLSTIQIESKFLSAIKKYFADVKFDLVLYSTPPITFAKVIQYIKKRDNAKTYLLLKDIFPQNAVDLGMMTKSGAKSVIYKYFRSKEKKLYGISDKIGCMSQANVDYVIKNNPEIPTEKVEICPNSIEVRDMRIDDNTKASIRKKYGIPLDIKVFVYGGNLGKPQGIPFVIDCLKNQRDNNEAYFLIVGDGTEYSKLESYVNEEKPSNVCLMKKLPKEDYDRMIGSCDVGLIFLDHRFTIPNFPSRLLDYMQAGLPVLACTDTNSDIGKVITEGGFGWWCESNDISGFNSRIKEICSPDNSIKNKILNSYEYLVDNYEVNIVVQKVLKNHGM